jgi:hypothetical protein
MPNRRPQSSCALSSRSSIQGEDDNPYAVGYRESSDIGHRVYTVRRELSEVLMSSPPRKVKTLCHAQVW